MKGLAAKIAATFLLFGSISCGVKPIRYPMLVGEKIVDCHRIHKTNYYVTIDALGQYDEMRRTTSKSGVKPLQYAGFTNKELEKADNDRDEVLDAAEIKQAFENKYGR
jgi:hypothetical protein